MHTPALCVQMAQCRGTDVLLLNNGFIPKAIKFSHFLCVPFHDSMLSLFGECSPLLQKLFKSSLNSLRMRPDFILENGLISDHKTKAFMIE